MKRLFNTILFSIILFQSSAFARSPKIPYGVYIIDQGLRSLDAAKEQKNLVIDHLSQDGFELYGERISVEAFIKKHQLLAIDLELSESRSSIYPSYSQIEAELKNLAKSNPAIFKLESIGKSVKGRELYVMKVSDNVGADEVEPELKLVANMHGDEIVGRELMMLFLKDLASAYASKDPRVVKLIEQTELYIMPSLNPDGAELKRRGNANYVDLNRDFPDFTTSDNQNSWSGRAPETMSMMKFQAARNFVLSANFHGGAVVVNYPWDTSKDAFPLEDLVIDLSLSYSKENPEMHASSEFPQGIVNGFDWYEVDGGMQDWSYYWHQDLQVTVELSQDKWPDYSSITSYYQKNRKGFLSYLENVYQGIGLSFPKNFSSGTIEIIDRVENKSLGFFPFMRGEFYKVLPRSNYLVKVFNKNKKLLRELSLTSGQNASVRYEQL